MPEDFRRPPAMNHHTRWIPLLTLLSITSLAAQELRHIGSQWSVAAAYDRARQRIVMPDRSGYSYEWDGNAWHRSPDAGSQPGFCYFDHATDRLTTVIEDIWGIGQALTFHQRVGHDWQAMPIAGGPQDRWGMGMSFDEQRNELVVFGGFDSINAVPLTGTWTFDGVTWTQHNPAASPSARYFPNMCYDSARQRTVLFSGTGIAPLNDTWEWDGANWSAVTTTTSPTSRSFAKMDFDSARGVTMLAGHTGSGLLQADFWEYDGTNWQQRASPPLPAGASPGTLIFDEARSEALLIGSYDSTGSTGLVFAWDGAQWGPRPGLGYTPNLGGLGSATADPTGNFVLRLAAGVNSQVLTAWDGNNWQTLSTTGPSPRFAPAMWSMSTATYVFGGVDASNSTLNDTWRWDGVSWLQMPTAVSPSARTETAIAFHASQNHALLFGGTSTTSQWGAVGGTWKFDGTSWQELTSGPQPDARRLHSMAYDPIRNRIVLHGGHFLGQFPGASTEYRDTWEHDGTSWTQVLTGSGPGPSTRSTMAFDWDRQTIVSVQAEFVGVRLWEYDGVAWTPVSAAGESGSEHPVNLYEPFAVTGPSGHLVVSDFDTLLELLPTPSSAQAYGTACTASAPHLTATNIPDLGQPNFAIEMTLAPTNSLLALAGADQNANVPVLGCTLLVAPVWTNLLASNALGYARMALPLPTTPSLLGLNFYFQAAALDATAPNGITLSRGLRITLGQ